MADGSDTERPDVDLEHAVERFLQESPPGVGLDDFTGLPEIGDEPCGREHEQLAGFEMLRRIGEGGMGVVFEARQKTALGRRVAVKLLRPFPSRAARERFRREVSAVVALDHPGIVPVVAADVDGEAPFLAMKFIDGISLSQVLHRLREHSRAPTTTDDVRRFVELQARDRRSTDGAGSATSAEAWASNYVRWTAVVALQACDALQHAHDRGVVHRDVKPGNLMLTAEGRVILLDFGIATMQEDHDLTRTGDFVGTLHYSPPEQVLGAEVDDRVDVYSIGATLYELLSLRRPHEGRAGQELIKSITQTDVAPLPRTLPTDLRTICHCALSRSRSERYATPGAMALDLRAYLDGRPIEARPPGLVARGAQSLRRHPRVTATLLIALLFVGSLIVRDRMRAGAYVRRGELELASARELEARYQALSLAYVDWYHRARAVNRVDYSELETRRSTLEQLRGELERSWEAAEQSFLGALGHVTGHRAAHDDLAELYALRLEHALFSLQDVLDRRKILELETRLAEHDPAGRWRALREHTGSVRVDCDILGAEIRLFRQGTPEPVLIGKAPLVANRIDEGSYVAVLRAAGHVETRLPLLVRRSAAYTDTTGMPPRELAVRLLPTDELMDGFVYVPAGWTLLDDDPPRWQRVEAFQIQELEVTHGQWIEWLNGPNGRARATREGAFLPRFGPGPHETYVVWNQEDQRWELNAGLAEPDWPVRGLSPSELCYYARSLDPPESSAPDDWYTSLPDPIEWTRAARGADGRRFAWGGPFAWSACAGYPSRGHEHYEPRPYPVGSFPADLSPVGVRDMAGSIAELTGEYRLSQFGEYPVRGGSFRSRERADMTTLAARTMRDEFAHDVGVRVVRRRTPAWIAADDEPPRAFFDDFERPDGDVVGNGWHEWAGQPLSTEDAARADDMCSLEGGRLVCRGELDNYSVAGTVCRRVHLPGRFRLTATLAYGASAPAGARGAGFGLETEFGQRRGQLSLSVTPRGDGLGDLVLCSTNAQSDRVLTDFELGVPFTYEITQLGESAEGRVWRAGTPRPATAQVVLEHDDELPPLRFLTLCGRNLEGGWIEVEEVRLELLE